MLGEHRTQYVLKVAALLSVAALSCTEAKEGSEDGGAAAGMEAGQGERPEPDGGPEPDGKQPEPVSLVEAHIRGDRYRKLIIEVDVVPGFAPEQGVMDQVFAGFADILDKPDGIEVVFDGELDAMGSSHAWSFDELRALTAKHMDLPLDDDVDRIHVMWLDGHDAADDEQGSVLGLAWGHRHIVMYKETLASGCAQLLNGISNELCRAAEQAVLTHEVGHVIGLTDNGLSMVVDHKDPDDGAHDRDRDSVMYWQYEREGLFEVLLERLQTGGDSKLEFDENSLADIAALRDR